MPIKAIVYTSNNGFTKQYAEMLGEKISLPIYSLKEVPRQISKGDGIIYLGWICANHIKGFSRAAKRFSVYAVCGVGLCDTGTLNAEVRKATNIPEQIPLFTLQGGFDRNSLKGISKFMISMLTKGLASQSKRTAQEDRMLRLLSKDANYVSKENLRDILEWYLKNRV